MWTFGAFFLKTSKCKLLPRSFGGIRHDCIDSKSEWCEAHLEDRSDFVSVLTTTFGSTDSDTSNLTDIFVLVFGEAGILRGLLSLRHGWRQLRLLEEALLDSPGGAGESLLTTDSEEASVLVTWNIKYITILTFQNMRVRRYLRVLGGISILDEIFSCVVKRVVFHFSLKLILPESLTSNKQILKPLKHAIFDILNKLRGTKN